MYTKENEITLHLIHHVLKMFSQYTLYTYLNIYIKKTVCERLKCTDIGADRTKTACSLSFCAET